MQSPASGAFIISTSSEQELVRSFGWRGPLLLAGDFNLPVESAIYGQYWAQFSNAFSAAGLGLGHTKFTRWHGVRIDHILAGPSWRFRRCWVGPDVKSDHRPLIADVEWVGVSD